MTFINHAEDLAKKMEVITAILMAVGSSSWGCSKETMSVDESVGPVCTPWLAKSNYRRWRGRS
jgi:hypothetical protein